LEYGGERAEEGLDGRAARRGSGQSPGLARDRAQDPGQPKIRPGAAGNGPAPGGPTPFRADLASGGLGFGRRRFTPICWRNRTPPETGRGGGRPGRGHGGAAPLAVTWKTWGLDQPRQRPPCRRPQRVRPPKPPTTIGIEAGLGERQEKPRQSVQGPPGGRFRRGRRGGVEASWRLTNNRLVINGKKRNNRRYQYINRITAIRLNL
jgi:hypothetical protein